MKLETVSKIKGWVALVAWVVAILAATVPVSRQIPVWVILVVGSSPLIALVYTVKWVRLRRFIRRAEYAGRVLTNR